LSQSPSALTPSRQLLVIEWTALSWPDLLYRHQARQLPALASLAQAGNAATLNTTPETWPLSHSLTLLRESGVPVLVLNAADLPAEARVQPDELAPELLSQFPPDEVARPALTAALCDLYSAHNELIIELSDSTPRLITVRYDLIPQIESAYAHSPFLAPALRAGFQILDLLLHDARAHLAPQAGMLLCSAGRAPHPGCAFYSLPGVTREKLPRLPTAEVFPAFLATMLGVRAPAGSALASPLPLDAAWLQPEIISPRPASTPASTPAVALRDLETRAATAADLAALARVFPSDPWTSSLACYLTTARANPQILAAAALVPNGGVILRGQPEQSAALESSLSRLLPDPATQSEASLHNANEVVAESANARAFLACGFVRSTTLDVWLINIADITRRLQAMPAPDLTGWKFRPATPTDIAWWSRRPEARSILNEHTRYSTDLSFVAELAGQPAGIILIERLVASPAIANSVVTAADTRPHGTFVHLIAHATRALQLGGVTQALFVSDEMRRETAAFARRCRSRHLRQTWRLCREGSPIT
jgi:hypothetical protein